MRTNRKQPARSGRSRKKHWWKQAGLLLLIAVAAAGLWSSGGSGRFAFFAAEAPQSEPETGLPQPAQTLFLQVAAEGGAQQMELEQYILGVVAAEMPASFEAEALKAQAVAARTYTLRKLLHGGCSRGVGDICTDSAHCQAWCSEQQMRDKWGERYAEYHDKLQAAVTQTAGQVLCYEGEVIEALFHSSSDGNTEDCAHVFSQDLPYLKSVSTPEETDQSEVSYSCAEWISLAEKALGSCGLKERELAGQIEVLSRYESGRVQTLRLGEKEISGNRARTIFSLRSADFSVRVEAGQVIFTVRGYGHGVGMSQRGADALAAEGACYTEILAHYYTGTTLALAESFLETSGASIA